MGGCRALRALHRRRSAARSGPAGRALIEERRRQLAEWAEPRLEPGERVRAIVVCRERRPSSPGEIFWEVLAGLAPGGTAGGAPKRQMCALMATDTRVVAFPLLRDGLGEPIGSWRRGQADVWVSRGLLGSKIGVGRLEFDLPPGTRGDAEQVAAAAAA